MNILRANRVLNYFEDWMPDNDRALVKERLDDLAIKRVFSCMSSSVFALEPKDIISLRQKNKKLREELNQNVKGLSFDNNGVVDGLLSEAIEANETLIKSKKWSSLLNGVNFVATLVGVVLGFTPAGFIYNQALTASGIGQGVLIQLMT